MVPLFSGMWGMVRYKRAREDEEFSVMTLSQGVGGGRKGMSQR